MHASVGADVGAADVGAGVGAALVGAGVLHDAQFVVHVKGPRWYVPSALRLQVNVGAAVGASVVGASEVGASEVGAADEGATVGGLVAAAQVDISGMLYDEWQSRLPPDGPAADGTSSVPALLQP